MNAFTQTIFGLLVALLLISCKKEVVVVPHQKQFLQLQKADWFLGRWENNSEEGSLSEIWKKQNDSTFYGESYFVIKNDTVFAETIQLQERNGVLSYVVSVPNQNEEKPVTFQLNKNTNEGLIFENPSHEYPTKISYKQVGTDSLVAEISGIKDGKLKSEFFKMKKVH